VSNNQSNNILSNSLKIKVILRDEFIEEMSEVEESNWWHEGRRRILHDNVKLLLRGIKNPKILDVGCGTGGTSNIFLKFGNLIGIDISFSALKIASKKGLENIFRSNLTNIPLQDEIFDIITALDVIEHVRDDSIVLLELKRLIKNTGYLIITVPAFQFLWSEHDVALSHYRRYTISTLTKVLTDSGFEITRISYFVSFIFIPYSIYRILTRNSINKTKPHTVKRTFPEIINKLLEKSMLIENALMKKINLPFGVSLICVAKKRKNDFKETRFHD